jgi:ubiquitin
MEDSESALVPLGRGPGGQHARAKSRERSMALFFYSA